MLSYKYKILVVDDEKGLVSVIEQYFTFCGYDVLKAYNGYEALKSLNLCRPDIIILDIMMPGMNGIELCKKIRGLVDCPIIFLSAKTKTQDKVIGLNEGADDYIDKPFEMEELEARIAAHLRRESRASYSEKVIKIFGDMCIDYTSRKVFIIEELIEFTRKEFEIIEELSMNKNCILSKETLYVHIWGFDKMGNNETVVEHVRKIRRKISEITEIEYIKTVWGVGYIWNQ